MKRIYYGGPIVTMEHLEDCPEAILVNNGIIQKIGTLKELLSFAGPRTTKIDLQGKCLMPGFLDAHSHAAMSGQMALFADLSDCNNFESIKNKMKKYIHENKLSDKDVAVGFGYDHNFLDEKRHPDISVLDPVSDNIPMLILHTSGHMGCSNSAMLSLCNINDSTPDPQGGRYGRFEGTSKPNGYLEETAMMGVQTAMGKRIKPDIFKIFSGMQKHYIENGVTTIQEGAANEGYLKLLKMADLLGKLKVDVVIYPLISDGAEKLCASNPRMIKKYKKHLKIGGYKMILDGSPQGRSAWMSKPYLGDDPDYCGYPWITDEKAIHYAQIAIRDNMQLLTHCNGDAASEQFLNAYETALSGIDTKCKHSLRPVMIHCQTVRNDQLDRMVPLQMIPSIFVGHVYYWGDIHMINFGPERGHHISPVKDALDRNLVVNFHQDTPITKPNMLHSVWCAVNRKSRNGKIIGENQKVSVYDALKAVTINVAYQYFEENSKGSIREGKRADLIILDKNPLDVPVETIKDIVVLETIKDGKTIYKR